MSVTNIRLQSEVDVLATNVPQVTSENPEERKEARRLRIKKRQEAKKKQELAPEELAAEEETFVDQTTAQCAAEIQRLALEANAKVINVKVTADEREVVRRQDADATRDAFLQRLELEDVEAQGMYEEVAKNWEPMLHLRDPLDIDEKVKEQKTRCDELLNLKNELIMHLKKDLADMDKAYVEDMDKQNYEIKELSDRIEKQITIIQRTNEKQLQLIEQALENERNDAIKHNQKRWEALNKQRDKEELEQMDDRFEQVEEFVLQMDEIMWDHIDKYRETKIELEVLIQELQKELEKLKATCLINSEKIGYNYQVLKKREEENIIVRSQQKRVLNRFTDVTNALRSRIDKARSAQAVELIKSKKEITRLREDMEQMQNKAHHFALVNDKKWRQVWLMYRERCDTMYSDVCFAEKMIHDLVLVEDPPPVPGKPPRINLVPKEPVVAVKKKKEKEYINEELVNRILTLIADNTGFLVEERLHALLEKYQKTSQNLCRIDAIFSALEVTRDEDVKALCSVMLRHARCPICVTSPVHALLTGRKQIEAKRSQPVGENEWNVKESTKHVGTSAALTREDIALKAEADRIIKICHDARNWQDCEVRELSKKEQEVTSVVADKVESVQDSQFKCSAGHDLEIDPTLVLVALSEFVSTFVSQEKEKLNELMASVQPPDNSTPSRKMPKEQVAEYWKQYVQLYTPAKAKFWDHLIEGLTDYYAILQERASLNDEVLELREEYNGLKQILQAQKREFNT